MNSLLGIILIHSIQDSLLDSLPLGDLFNLSRTNSSFRAALHGFEFERRDQELLSSAQSRPPLHLGHHDTPHWKNCKTKSLLLCSEARHSRGEKIGGCRVCSMPVCEACIIKSSFGKRDERTFSNRTRSFCPDCHNFGNVHGDIKLKEDCTEYLPSYLNLGKSLCICTAKDGHLCIQCKTMQNCNTKERLERCHGKGCSRAKEGGFAGRICLWCDRRLPSENDRATARRDYDLRHLLARSHSTYEHPPDGNVRPPDPIEEERKRLLNHISARRSLTADAAEEARWHRSESLRRSETFNPPPPIRRQWTTPAVNSGEWRDTDSIAPTLVERDYWEASDPPDYTLEDSYTPTRKGTAVADGQVLS